MYILDLPFVEKHIIIGAEEGVYSLNFSEKLHEAEMEQVRMYNIMHGCMSVNYKRVLETLSREVIQPTFIGRDCTKDAPAVHEWQSYDLG